jgi:hypothetical protein
VTSAHPEASIIDDKPDRGAGSSGEARQQRGGEVATREQGIRRTASVTVGLAVASLAGTAAIGAAAAANTPPKLSPTVAPTDLPSGSVPQPSPSEPLNSPPGPDDGGPPDVITIGS